MTLNVIELTRQFAQNHFDGDASGHDWWHVHRVWQMAKKIAASEGADVPLVEIAALLHDVADWKLSEGGEEAGMRQVQDFLDNKLPTDQVEKVCSIISQVSFKGAGVDTPVDSLEGQCVQDADRLDAIGAMGIARAFAYGGHHGRLIHHPDHDPELHDSFEAYKKNKGPSINHFYEKLLLLKERMHTNTAKKIAEERHRFMQQYLDQFFKEWEGEL